MRDATANQELDEGIFDTLAALAYSESGLNLVPEKRLMVQSRLRHRLRALSMRDFASYAALVTSADGVPERRHMISALTTNVSHFFREPHHFALLTERVMPVMQAKARAGERVRVWSAGCSNGQEPYSILMHLLMHAPDLAEADFRILATDIDPRVVAHGVAGRYSTQQTAAVPQGAADFLVPTDVPGTIQIRDDLRALVSFRELNLLSDWPMKGRFDAIFCRNVVIYFDVATQEKLWPRFARALAPHGLFFLGHSERVISPGAFGLNCIGPTTYAHAGADQRR